MEIKREVKLMEIVYNCDVTGCKGELKPTGIDKKGLGHTLYQHRCDCCNGIKIFDKKYPEISSEYVLSDSYIK